MPKAWRKDIEGDSPIPLQERIILCLLAVYKYYRNWFEICDAHVALVADRLQLRTNFIPRILPIRLAQIWGASSTRRTLRRFVNDNREWFVENMRFGPADKGEELGSSEAVRVIPIAWWLQLLAIKMTNLDF